MKSLVVKNTKVYCFDPKFKKYMLMGFKVGNVFFKKVDSRHFMKVLNGYGLQYDAFVQFEKEGIEQIRILEEHGRNWATTPSDWLKNGRIADYGHGKQIFLSLKYFKAYDMEKIKSEYEKKEVERAAIIQDKLV